MTEGVDGIIRQLCEEYGLDGVTGLFCNQNEPIEKPTEPDSVHIGDIRRRTACLIRTSMPVTDQVLHSSFADLKRGAVSKITTGEYSGCKALIVKIHNDIAVLLIEVCNS